MHLLRFFPELARGHFRVTSSSTPIYNCIAWAAEDDTRWWWPDGDGDYFWPIAVPRTETLDAFKQAYAQLGYEECSEPYLEAGWQKVAIFVDASGVPTHAARQLSNGYWTSKCGRSEDIEHILAGLEGESYGRAVCFMRRRITTVES
jgi:hypothetical protein